MYSPSELSGSRTHPTRQVVVHTLIKLLPFVGFTLFYLSVFHPFVSNVRFVPPRPLSPFCPLCPPGNASG